MTEYPSQASKALALLAALVGGRVIGRKVYVTQPIADAPRKPCQGCAFAAQDGYAPDPGDPTYRHCARIKGCADEGIGTVQVEVKT